MSLSVEILNQQAEELPAHLENMLSGLMMKAALTEGVVHGEVVISFVNNEQIQELNRQFRNLDKPTDVLSFPLDDADIIGDIIISMPRAREQADEYGHSLQREIGFLAIHGFLHLLGYDHHTDEEEKQMFSRQEQILREYGLFR
jgi:probable rRNA maturation factor